MPLLIALAIGTVIEAGAIAWFFSNPDNVLLASILLISLMAVGV